MRINKYLSTHTALSRRGADKAIEENKVFINQRQAKVGDNVDENDVVWLNGKKIAVSEKKTQAILFNKPAGYVCSRKGQGSKTVYSLLPSEFEHLNCVGRLDKESRGLLVFTNDGELANQLTHPKYQKNKVYRIKLDKPLAPLHQQMISDFGLQLSDGISKLILQKLDDDKSFSVSMREGRNRQIRRTFEALGYKVVDLERTQFGDFGLGNLAERKTKLVTIQKPSK